jgi:hypothetical protein
MQIGFYQEMVNLTPKEKSPNVSVRLSGGLEALKN